MENINLLLATIPMQHDVLHLDFKITRINSELENLAEKHNPALQTVSMVAKTTLDKTRSHETVIKTGEINVINADIGEIIENLKNNLALPLSTRFLLIMRILGISQLVWC
ncbi:hypothetical protein J6590_023958 [Homalodisca vitripennis]|nr:hypothetical protein J6590_023958 [Homalodisca vitripennis]